MRGSGEADRGDNANQLLLLAGQAEEAEQRCRTFFENVSDVVTVLTLDGVVLEANERWRTVLHMDPSDMLGRNISEFAAPGHELATVERYRETIATGGGRARAVPLRRADGAIVYLEFSNTVLEIDGVPRVFALGHDVTEQVESAQRLAAAEERYRLLIERIPDAIWAANERAEITFITDNIVHLTGYTAVEMASEDLAKRAERIHPDDRAHVVDGYKAMMEAGTPFDLEYRRQRKDGTWVWLRNRAFAVYERDGARYTEGLISDISERKRLEETVQQAQKMEAIGQLTGGIAHDFNNMVAAILAYSAFLFESLGASDPRREDVDGIRLAAERAAALTRQLLAFSRRQVLDPTVVNLADTVASLEKMLCRLIGEDIKLTVRTAPDLDAVRVDVGQIEQVIMNLAVNARDAMPMGGRMVIETANLQVDRPLRTSDGILPPGAYVVLSVRDDGSGMTAETMRRIFEPFFTTKSVGKGTGLGLSTCYGIVRQSGGHLTVRSQLGLGTTFEVYLPCVEGRAISVRRRRATSAPPPITGNETILLVEDDDHVRSVLARILTSRGYTALVARDAAAAIVLAEAHPGELHLVLTDVIMPGASGPELVRHLQQRRPNLKALYISGYVDHPALYDQVLLPGTNLLQKPFTPEVLAQRLRVALAPQSPEVNAA